MESRNVKGTAPLRNGVFPPKSAHNYLTTQQSHFSEVEVGSWKCLRTVFPAARLWMRDGQAQVHPHHGTLLGNERQGESDTCCNVVNLEDSELSEKPGSCAPSPPPPLCRAPTHQWVEEQGEACG